MKRKTIMILKWMTLSMMEMMSTQRFPNTSRKSLAMTEPSMGCLYPSVLFYRVNDCMLIFIVVFLFKLSHTDTKRKVIMLSNSWRAAGEICRKKKQGGN